MTIEEINIQLENLRDAVDKADRLFDSLTKNSLVTKEIVAKVDKARAALEAKITELKAARKELQEKTAETAPTDPAATETTETPTPAPPAPRTEILGSVGYRGKNDPLDVELVQKLLNQRKGEKLVVDGVWGTNTNTSIVDLQRRIFQSWGVDGRIDPGGKTWKWLIGSDKLPKLPPAPPPPPPAPVKVTPPPQQKVTQPTVQEKVTDVLGFFAEKVLPYEKEFFMFEWNSPKVWLGYGFFVQGSLYAYSNASLTGSKGTNSVSVTGSAKVATGVSASIGWGEVSQGWYGTWGLEARGTMKGELAASFYIRTVLSAAGQTMTGSISSTADITATLSVSAKVTGGVGFGGSYETESYTLGKITFLQATTPMFASTYDFSARKFSFKKSGSWSVRIHPQLVNTLRSVIS